MKLSIVTSLYRSERFIEEFYRRCVSAAEALTDSFEIIMVNDGSPDGSLDVALRLHEKDPRLVVVDLSRNFGHHRALMTGLSYARGEQIFLIDCDLQEEPELVGSFAQIMAREACDVVYGVQERRSGGLGERISGEIIYFLLNALGDLPAPRNFLTVRLMTRRYVRSLLRHRERELVIGWLWVATGYKQVGAPVAKHERRSPSTYGGFARFKLALDIMTSFSGRLLYYVFYAGCAVSLLSFLVLAFFVVRYIATGDTLAGWTSIMASVWMFGGLTVLLIGLIGVYIARIFSETKRRPYAIVRDIYRSG